MKQIGIVLLLTALAALGFVAVRLLDAPPPAPPGPTVLPRAGGPAPSTPQTNPGARTDAAPTPPARPTVDWKSMQDPDWIVPLDERWRFDLSEVDLEAEVLCRVDGVAITRDDFRAYVCMTDAAPLVEARLSWHLAAEVAAAHGGSIGIDDAMFETMLQQWGEARGLDRTGALMASAQSARLNVTGALQMRRWIDEAMLANFQHVLVYDQLPAGMRARLADSQAPEHLTHVLKVLQEARADLANPENLRKLSGALETLALYWGDTRREDSVRRSTSMLDGVLEPGVVATVHTGPLGERVEPPWLIPGAHFAVHADELWPFIGSELARSAAEKRLRELIWFRVLDAALARGGHRVEPEANWMAFWQEHEMGSAAVMNLAMIQVMLNGFPTLNHYRAVTGVQRGFAASQPAGWNDEAAVRECFERNRFFVQRWNPELEIALFPAQRPVAGGGAVVDWERSRQEAEALRSRVDGGEDFGELRLAQQRELLETYRQLVSESDADSLRNQFQLGSLVLPIGELRKRLQETRFDELIDCVSVVRSAVVELDVGEVSRPWRTNLGYAVIRLNGAVVGGLEQEFEDVEFAARQFLEDSSFMLWANGVLAAASME